MSTILVVDDMAIFRDPIAASLRLEGYKTLCAPNGKIGLEMLRDERPDLVLLDMAMPVMDGLTFLRQMRADPQISGVPVVLLTAVSEKQYVIEAGRLGVRDYMLKSRFSMKELLERVRKKLTEQITPALDGGAVQPLAATGQLATAPVPPALPIAVPPSIARPIAAPSSVKPAPSTNSEIPRLLTREECIARAQTALEARTLSGVVAQVISIAASPRGEMSELAALIAKDSVLSARVLQVANSAAYASRGFVSSIPHAVRLVGVSAVRNIATGVGIFDAMPECTGDGFNPIRCWQHSFAVAMLCEKLMASQPEEAAIAYLVGLCHDLGEILLHTHFAAEYRQVLDVQAKTGRPRDDLVLIMLGMSHGELVRTILSCLGLPENIRRPIESLHQRDEPSSPLGRSLRMADLYANGLQLASSTASPVAPLLSSALKAIGFDTQKSRPDNGVLRSEVLGLTQVLARLPSSVNAEFMLPLLSHRNVRLWVARETVFSDFDPLTTALESMAEAKVHSRLPLPTEAGEYEGVVVIARSSGQAGFGVTDVPEASIPQERLLWAIGQLDTPLPPLSPVRATVFPVSLEQLAAFVQQVAKVRPPAAPAAA